MSIQDELAYSLWAEPPPSSQTTTDDEMALSLRPAEVENITMSLKVNCGYVQIQTCPDPITFDPMRRTVLSIKLALAAARAYRPELALEF